MKKFVLVLLFCMITSLVYADQKVFIQIRFQEETAYGRYSDALYFTQTEYDALEQTDIDTFKQQRVDNWIYVIENPSVYIEPTLEDLEGEKAYLLERIEEIQAQIDLIGI